MAKKFPINLGMFLSNHFLLYDNLDQFVITSNDEKVDYSNEMINFILNFKKSKQNNNLY